jgi:hypothetical protein
VNNQIYVDGFNDNGHSCFVIGRVMERRRGCRPNRVPLSP